MICRLRDNPELLREERALHRDAETFWRTRSLGERLKLLTPLHERSKDADRFLLHLALALRESPTDSARASTSFHALLQGFQTNAQRQLLAQRFALSVSV
jgi:hypothetical protein